MARQSCQSSIKQKRTCSPTLSCVLGRQVGGFTIFREGGSDTSEGVCAHILECDFNVNPGITSSQLLATIISSTLDDLGQECVAEAYTQRILFMAIISELEVTEKPHKNDDLRT